MPVLVAQGRHPHWGPEAGVPALTQQERASPLCLHFSWTEVKWVPRRALHACLATWNAANGVGSNHRSRLVTRSESFLYEPFPKQGTEEGNSRAPYNSEDLVVCGMVCGCPVASADLLLSAGHLDDLVEKGPCWLSWAGGA